MKKFNKTKLFIFPLILLVGCLGTNKHKNKILIYCDKGVGEESLKNTIHTLSNLLDQNYDIKTIKAKSLINDDWENETSLFVMPGGADLPYCQELNGMGNKKIKKFVEDGGSYLGICAGSYYGGNYIEFAKGTEIEVLGSRELSFFPGIVKGPAFEGFDYKTNKGAKATNIKWLKSSDLNQVKLYYNGGGYFVSTEQYKNTSVLATYNDLPNNPAAIVKCSVGKGIAILSGVHFEYSPDLLNQNDQYLKLIIPQLYQDNVLRIQLVKIILMSLGLKTNP